MTPTPDKAAMAATLASLEEADGWIAECQHNQQPDREAMGRRRRLEIQKREKR